MSQHFEDEDHVDLNIKWNEMFHELEEYKEQHGDCDVPLNFENSKLANWVNFLRWCHRRYNAGKKVVGGLTQEKIALLESIGFQWSGGNASVRSFRSQITFDSNRSNRRR